MPIGLPPYIGWSEPLSIQEINHRQITGSDDMNKMKLLLSYNHIGDAKKMSPEWSATTGYCVLPERSHCFQTKLDSPNSSLLRPYDGSEVEITLGYSIYNPGMYQNGLMAKMHIRKCKVPPSPSIGKTITYHRYNHRTIEAICQSLR